MGIPSEYSMIPRRPSRKRANESREPPAAALSVFCGYGGLAALDLVDAQLRRLRLRLGVRQAIESLYRRGEFGVY
jgi:hypothetical protein